MDDEIFTAAGSATSSSQTNTVIPTLVTASATATATSMVSYDDAYTTAVGIAQKIADSTATNEANVITQAVNLAQQIITGGTGIKYGQGSQGPQGPQGVPGPQGFNGTIGFTGPTGVISGSISTSLIPSKNILYDLGSEKFRFRSLYLAGSTIYLGGASISASPEGTLYVTSSSGITGTFNYNTTSSTGPQGFRGNDGSTGPKGSQGPKGSIGPKGSQGIQGLNGRPGSTGAIGSQGIQGLNGSPGSTGPTGAQGTQGLNGSPGYTGPRGSQGIQGLNGNPGYTGPTGPASLGSNNSGAFILTLTVTYIQPTLGKSITDNSTVIHNIEVSPNNLGITAAYTGSNITITNSNINISSSFKRKSALFPTLGTIQLLNGDQNTTNTNLLDSSTLMYNLSTIINTYNFVGGKFTNTYGAVSSSFNINASYTIPNFGSVYSGPAQVSNQTFIGSIYYLTFNNAALSN